MIDKVDLERNIPEELKRERAWVGWTPDPDTGRPKCPVLVSAKSRRASTRKPETWTSFDRALAFYEKYADGVKVGIGFVLTQGLVYVDIDCALDDTGELREWAKPYVEPWLDKSYMERSPSGRGLHIIAKGVLPGGVDGGTRKFPEHAQPDGRVPEVAMFASGKYTTITGDVWKGQKRPREANGVVEGVWVAAGILAPQAGSQSAGKAPKDTELVTVEKVPGRIASELRKCSVMDAPDRSSARFKFYAEACRAHLREEELFSLILGSEWFEASGAAEKGRDQLWADIHRSYSKATTAEKEFEAFEKEDEKQAAEVVTSWKELGLAVVTRMTKAGPVHECAYGAHNMAVVLSKHPKWKGRLRHNAFKDRLELDGQAFEGRGLTRIAEFLRGYLEWEREPQHDLVWKALEEAAHADSYNPVQDYLHALVWDGVPRLDTWMERIGCEDEAGVGRKWMLSLVARALDPGCKVDTVLVLEGEQGKKKSAMFRELAGGAEFFTDAHVGMDKDGMMVVHGNWIVELAELASMKRAEREVVKSFISAQENSYRPPYGRSVVRQPRHFVIVGSTNDEQYLTDPSGARRFWPVVVTRTLDVEWVRKNRDQLFAEAVRAHASGESWWFDVQPEALAQAQEARYVHDIIDDKVGAFIVECGTQPFTLAQLVERNGWQMDRSMAMRLADILKKRGFKKRQVMFEGERSWRWAKPEWELKKLGLDLDDIM